MPNNVFLNQQNVFIYFQSIPSLKKSKTAWIFLISFTLIYSPDQINNTRDLV